MNAPKVFVSHASEDKDRFVLQFAKRLRDNGIDAWIDKWEMLPGDSLVDKIFEIGLKEATAVLVILSANSVTKPWVREEINAAFVKRINSKCKIIPIIIDDCDVPECLQTTLWEKIPNLSSYDEEYKRIELSILGKTDKPQIGSKPKYTAEIIEQVQELTEIDSLVFKITCETAIEKGQPFLMVRDVIEKGNAIDLTPEIITESLEILEQNYFIEITGMMQPEYNSLKVLLYAFSTYYQHYNSEYNAQINLIGSLIINNGLTDNTSIAQAANIDVFIVDHILELLDNKGYIRNLQFLNGTSEISNVSVEFKRLFRK
jgi:TIR domain.